MTRFNQAGLTMVELMIALLLSSLLLLGVLQMFSNTTASDRTGTALARLQESGRVGLELIAADARRTGYQGCVSSANTITVGTITFPNGALTTSAENDVTFYYAVPGTTGSVLPGTNKDCADTALRLSTIRYRNNNGTLCRSVDGGNCENLLNNAAIARIEFGLPQSNGNVIWRNSNDSSIRTAAALANAKLIRLTLRVSEPNQNNMARDFSSTFELRNRL